jgi:hypothetical protein
MNPKNWKLATRLLLSFGLVGLIAGGLGLLGLRSTMRVSATMNDLYDNWTLAIVNLARADSFAQGSTRSTWNVLFTTDDADRETQLKRIEERNAGYVKELTKFRATVQTGRERELLATMAFFQLEGPAAAAPRARSAAPAPRPPAAPRPAPPGKAPPRAPIDESGFVSF